MARPVKDPAPLDHPRPIRRLDEWLAWERPLAAVLSRPGAAFLILLLIAAIESAALVLRAAGKPFWYDELLTLHVSALRPLAAIPQALRAGVDGMPLGFYGMILAARLLPGNIHALLRLPSIAGYILALLGVYWFATKRLPPAAGLIAVLFLALSPFRDFAVEARGYAPLVGFLAIGAAVWQRVEARWWVPLLLALCLALASSSHYYGVVAFAFFGLAEVVWSLISRRIRWAVWGAFLLASIPFLLSLPTLMHLREAYGQHFWSKPTLTSVLFPYRLLSGMWDTVAAGFALFWILTALHRLARQDPPEGPASSTVPPANREADFAWMAPATGFSPAEMLLVGGFLVYPSVLAALIMVQHGGYTVRYGWPVILGLAWAVASMFRSPRLKSASARLLLAMLLLFVWQDYRDFKAFFSGKTELSQVQAKWSKLAEFSQEEPAIPIAISNGHTYLEMMQYADPKLRGRLVRLVDTQEAIRWTGLDSADRNDLQLSRLVPLNVENRALFLAAHKKFYVSSDTGFDVWLVPSLLAHHYRLRLLSEDAGDSIYLAEE